MKKFELTIKKDMLSPKFSALETAKTLVLAVNPVNNIPCTYVGKVDKTNLAGRVIEATSDDGGITMQELTEKISRPYKLKFTGAGTIPGTALLQFEEIELVKTADANYDIDGQIDRIVNSGICGKTELQERIAVMREHKCSDRIVFEVLAQTKDYGVPARRPSAIYKNTDPKSANPILKVALMNALLRNSMIFEGDKSVGKNVCAETLAWLLGMPYYIVGFTKKTTMGELSGEKTTAPSALSMMSVEEYMELDANDPAKAKAVAVKGSTISLVTEEGELVKWMKNGGLIMFNEVNMADSNLLQSFLNPLADGTGFVTFPGHGRVELNPDCVLVGSQNPGYTGACAQNNATLSRLGLIKFPYPDSVKDALKSATVGLGLNDKVYEACDTLYKVFRKSCTGGHNAISDNVLNIRGFVRALRCYAQFEGEYPLAEAIKSHVAAWVTDDERSTIHTWIDDKIAF